MKENRKIRKVLKSKPTLEGAGVHLKRAFGFSEVPGLGPLLLPDHFRSCARQHDGTGSPDRGRKV